MKAVVHLNRKVALEAPVHVADGAGGQSVSWQMLGILWADIRAGAGREAASEIATVSTVVHRIIVRASPEGAPSRPRPDQRFREGGRLFRILAVSEYDLAARYLICQTREEVAA